jgi:hypothetical protein
MTVPDFPVEEPPRDVLAAEAFALPAPDPRLHGEPAHDILAAEEFPLPAPDPVVARHAASPPPPDPNDPAGVAPPHDVLAAEEFAVPGTVPHSPPPGYAPVPDPPGLREYLPRVAVGVLLVSLVVRRVRAARRK